MSRAIIATLFGLLALFSVTSVSADPDPYFRNSVWASPIYDQEVCGYPSYTGITIATSDLDGLYEPFYYPDTFLVVEGTGHGTYYNDNAPGSLRSSLTAYSTNGCFHILVFAKYYLSRGTTDIWVNSQLLHNDIPFGGTLVPLTNIIGDVYSIHTVHRPWENGATLTDLYLFDDQWNLRLFDDDSGAENQATLYEEYVDSGDMILVAADSTATQGYTDLAVNSCHDDPDRAPAPDTCQGYGYDQDADSLADSLEADLGTNQLDFDTDGDGLSDYYELIGRFGSVQSVTLSARGADAHQRDLFLEIDRSNNVPAPSQNEILDINEIFTSIPGLQDPNSIRDGIKIHVDVGYPCTNPSICGDWGGVDVGLPYDGEYALNYDSIESNGEFDELRQGLFHYVYLTDYGSGQSPTAPSSSLYVNGTKGGVGRLIAHELGHNLGLQHWGDIDDTPSDKIMNVKAAYPSIVNYAFQEVNGVGFSAGTMATIDHRHLNETSYSPGVDKTYLEGKPFFYEVTGDSVDFNQDGRTGVPGQPGVDVLFDVSPMFDSEDQEGFGITGNGWPELYQSGVMHDEFPGSGGAGLVAEPGSSATTTLWAAVPIFKYPDIVLDSVVKVRKGTLDASGWSWGSFHELPGLVGLGEAWATWFPVSGTAAEIVVLFPDMQGRLNYYYMDVNNPTSGTWAVIPGWPAGVKARSATAAVSENYMTIAFRDADALSIDENVYVAALHTSGTWTSPELVSGVRSVATPGLVKPPGLPMHMVTSDTSSFLDPEIVFYSKDSGLPGSGAGWNRNYQLGQVPSGLENLLPEPKHPRITALSLPYLDENRQPFSDGSTYVGVFWNILDDGADNYRDNWFMRRAYTRGYLSPTSSLAFSPAGWRGHRMLARPYPWHSVAVAGHNGNAMALYTATSDWRTNETDTLWFAPYVTGLAPVNTGYNNDNNDAYEISLNLCKSAALLEWRDDAECYCSMGHEANPFVCYWYEPPPPPLEEPCPI